MKRSLLLGVLAMIGCGTVTVKQKYQPMTVRAKVEKAEPAPVAAKLEANRIDIREKVQFESGSKRILPESYQLLEEVAKIMIDNPHVTLVQIEGHTDDVGRTRKNQKLSQRRAESVREFLIDRGVAPERLTAKGFGEEKPIADNDSDDGREQNRRVEFNILTQSDTMAKK